MSLAERIAEVEADRQADPLRILFWDIETAPLLAYVWSAKTHYVGSHQFIHDSFMLCWAAKWADGKKVHSDVLTSEEAREQDDRRVVVSLANLLRQADVVVAHNGDRFDIPMLNNRLLTLGEEPLGPVKTVDTLKLAKKTVRLASNKLDYLAEQMGCGRKIKTSFQMWKDCYHGHHSALKQMVKYNRQDVRVLEDVYAGLEPYVKGLPRLVDAAGSDAVCPTCGSADLSRDGWHRTNASSFPRFRCGSCKRHCRSRKADPSKRVALHPL